jgi:hypothetical protein
MLMVNVVQTSGYVLKAIAGWLRQAVPPFRNVFVTLRC